MDRNEIRVLGTSFYIRSNDEDLVSLNVTEGHVQISDQNGQLRDVRGGQSISYEKSTGKFIQTQDQAPPASDWKKGFLVFEDVPLVNVFGKLSIYFGVTFKIDCNRIDEMAGFNSRIQNDDENTLDTYLTLIQKIYKVSIDKIDDSTYRVYGGPCK